MNNLTTHQPTAAFMPGIAGLPFFTRRNNPDARVPNGNPAKHIEHLLASAGIGFWSFDVIDKKMNLCAAGKSFFGLGENQEIDTCAVFKRIEPACRKALLLLFKNVLMQQKTAGLEIQVTITGKKHWLKVTAEATNDHTDKPTELLMGTLVDITAQKQEQIRKEDCMAMLSHELRSPLTTMKLYVQMVINQAKQLKDTNTANLLSKADTQATSMNRLIDNFLAMSVVNNGQLDIATRQFNMAALLRDVATEMQLKYPENRFKVSNDSNIPVTADGEKIAQVLINYISNAVKYSQPGSLVTINCSARANGVTVSVTDQGSGISAADQLNLFERFYRTRQTDAGGFGLGLYLVKQIIECHGGKVWVESQLGSGSAFYFSLPHAC